MGTSINKRIAESGREHTWRFESMFHLGAIAAEESLPSGFRDVLDEELVEIAMAIGAPRGDALALVDREELVDHLRDSEIDGLLVCVATPLRSYQGDGDSHFYSWGHYSMQWVYGEDLDALLPKIEAWVEERCAEDREKSVRRVA